ncbi:Frag1/DRAM/Sfk1 family-domain-containing protein [Penicillium taxi]|uniref:Frag1/DRAM/Sfk1 family-domain-containing protein n=1 Tax=Penicillium taxi TaxID=168475 RepID=UPI0025454664|nr:Frag1/DRAM/Sfk1 family-domain-containing protein [Penicillium taxi]KAJ5894384.1 Frag1/DRAM/Sfk1 family-domain-containing protein [Penicillium taxi]
MWIISFWVFPVVSASMWLAMLIAMIAVWAREGEPVYSNMSEGQTIAYISDVGAEGLKPLFITGSVITVVFLDLAFLSERWLRHAGQLLPNKGILDKACACLSIFFSIAGALGLILLSCFDTRHYPRLHDGFLIMFMAAYLISAIFICAEYLRIGIFYRAQHRCLLVSFWIKVAFIIIEIALAIGFAVCMKRAEKRNASAILEWVIAFVFTGYILSFVVDLLPSVRTRRHLPQGEKRGMDDYIEPHHTSLEQPLTHDSTGPNFYRGSRV